MLSKRVQIKEPYGYKCLSTEGEERSSSFKLSTLKCVTLILFEAEVKKLWIEDWLKELELVREMFLCLEEVACYWNLKEVDCLLVNILPINPISLPLIRKEVAKSI
jgi:hypothetical protein